MGWAFDKSVELSDKAMRRNEDVHDTVYRTALDLETDQATAAALVASVEKKGKAKPAAPGVWHIAGINKNEPIVLELQSIDGGTRFLVTQALIVNGTPLMSQAWSGFRDRVAKAAEAQGVGTRLTEVAAA